MSGHLIRLLHLEDNAGDRLLVEAKLLDAAPGQFVVTHVERLADAVARLRSEQFAVILCDLTLPDSDKLSTVNTLIACAPDLPLVVLTGTDDDALGKAAIHQGAQDYLIKSDASAPLIARTLHHAIERKRLEHDLREAKLTLERRVAERTAELEAMLAQLAESSASARALAETASDAIISSDADGRIQSWNGAAEKMFGYTRDEALGQPLTLIMPERYRDRHSAGMARTLSFGEPKLTGRPIELHGLAKSGNEFPIELSLSAWIGVKGTMFAGIIRNISERKAAEDWLRKLSLAVEQSPESVVVTDLNANIEYVNEAFVQKTGYSRDEVLGKNPRILQSGKTAPETFLAMWQALTLGQSWNGEFHNKRKDGSEYTEHAVITPIRLTDGTITHYVAVKEDITAKRAAEDEITSLAFFDALTQLPNRRLLIDRLKQALASIARNQRYGALLFIDLDNFKILNDTLGHDIGDLLLQQVAQRLKTCVREGDTVARLGGDEFVVMLEDLSDNIEESAAQTKTVGEKIIATLNQPYQLASYPHHSTPSIGITLFSDQEEEIDELLRRADLAMYEAKAAGRNTLRFFDHQMQAVVTARAALEAGLRDAITEGQLVIHYQPQVVGEGRLTGAEVLLRWNHPRRGMVSPAEFIPLAEDTGLIRPIGHWVLQKACAQLASWAGRQELAHLSVSVNVSARQFHHKDFLDQVLTVVDQTGANPQLLKLELTESLLVEDVDGVINKMAALKMKGVGFSMDDFGTGYSSLSYLKRLPLDQLKIDQGFVRNILTDPNDAAIAKMVIVLAESMDLAVIAEGVETEPQREFLTFHGCTAYQGYLFSRPLPLEDFERFAWKAFADEQRLLQA